MHHSRLGTLMIDCLDNEFDASFAFWANALNLMPHRRPSRNQRYATLGRIDGPLFVRLQRVDSNPGYHLDIETDDLLTEVARLEGHGAIHKRRIKRWWVAEDPSGNAFCVIRPESDDFPQNANSWEGK